MDTLARGLLVASKILDRSGYVEGKKERYESYDSGKGAAFERGELGLEELAGLAAERRWCMNQFGTRTDPFGGPTYSPTIAWDSGLPSSTIRFNTLHPILASCFCDS